MTSDLAQVLALAFSGVNLLALLGVAVKAGRLLAGFDALVTRMERVEIRVDRHDELILKLFSDD